MKRDSDVFGDPSSCSFVLKYAEQKALNSLEMGAGYIGCQARIAALLLLHTHILPLAKLSAWICVW